MYTKISSLILFIFSASSLFGSFPQIDSINDDILYKQIQSDINENSKRIILRKEILPVQFFEYYISDNDSIFTVSSKFNLSYDTIATINKIENQLFFNTLKSIIVPNCQGVYLKKNIYSGSQEISIGGETFFFYPGRKFTGQERLDFLITPFKSPLKSMTITSGFGYRENPFTKTREFHSGIDLKASVGTIIYSPYKGRINNIGYSDFYGNYLIIEHTHGYSSHYYHLKNIKIKEGSIVKKGDIVALTGNSGRSTGPHLHFEIQYNSEPIDPRILLGDV